ncbi:MAG: CoA transferase subunit A [Christensenellales bacterium]|jgi:glutaconate CoA-transferase subunit A
MSKITQLHTVLEQIQDGSMIALGGNVMYRSPVGVATALAKAGKKNLHLVKTAMAMEADLLCGTGSVSTVSAGFVGYETQYGLCAFYRKGVESGAVQAQEHACYSVITALRAASYGVPFLPIRGFNGSDLVETIGFKTVKDPYTGEELLAIAAMRPDVGILHVQKADRFGNCEIIGSHYEDQIIARAAKKLLITCEEIVPDDYFGTHKKADLSGVTVTWVVQLKNGAAPGACPGYYDIDHETMQRFKTLKTPEQLKAYLEEGES